LGGESLDIDPGHVADSAYRFTIDIDRKIGRLRRACCCLQKGTGIGAGVGVRKPIAQLPRNVDVVGMPHYRLRVVHSPRTDFAPIALKLHPMPFMILSVSRFREARAANSTGVLARVAAASARRDENPDRQTRPGARSAASDSAPSNASAHAGGSSRTPVPASARGDS